MQEGWNFTPILIPLLALLAGWVIGFFDSNLRTSKKIKQAEDSARAAIQAAEKRLEKEREQWAAEASAVVADEPGLLRLKNEHGTLLLELDGVRVNIPLDPFQRKRLIELLNAIRPWLEGKPAVVPSPPAAPQPAPPPPPSAPPPPSPQPARSTSAAVAASSPPPKAAVPESVPHSIVEQINVILQTRIAGTPLASPGIFLRESANGGVLVYIGVNKYQGVDEVPDEEAKAAIRAAIAEWERKYTPGL